MIRRLAVLLTAAALVVPASPAHAEPTSISVDTWGNGHGKGLSQYGAKNRAEAGHSYTQILDHYYPGTDASRAKGKLRIRITADDEGDDLVVDARDGLTARSLGNGTSWTLPARRDGKPVKRWRITPSGERSVLSFRTSAWKVWRTAPGDAEFVAAGKPITLLTPDGPAEYRGVLRSVSTGSGRDTVNVVGLDVYVQGVIARESPAYWPAAALQAQAVAARSYAVYERASVGQNRYYDLCDTSSCQVYGGVAAEDPRTTSAARATAGEVRTYEGEPAFTQFSASNGGYSASGDFPYLVAEYDEFDHGYPEDPDTRTFTGNQVTRHWAGLGDLVSVEVTERDTDGTARRPRPEGHHHRNRAHPGHHRRRVQAVPRPAIGELRSYKSVVLQVRCGAGVTHGAIETMRALTLLLSTALLATVTATAPSAHAADDIWRVPADAAITIKGHGYGHGHGMSQYGAEGAARQGLGHRRILAFYYPGTKRGTSTGRVTVHISADTGDDLVVVARKGLTVRDRAGGKRMALPDNGATRWKVAVGSDGVNRVSYRLRREWHPWRRLDGQGEFFAHGKPITLVTPIGERAYRGWLRVGVTSSGDRVTVNALSLDSYLKGVVPLEIPALWSAAAVRAQAVAARTYASYERRHPKSRAYQLCDTTSCQVYGGYDAEHPASNRAVDATAGDILTSGGDPAFTQFSSSSGGLDRGRVDALPARPEGPVRRLAGQPGALLVGEGRRQPARAGLARGRRPAPDRGDRARRQRRLGRPGRPDRDARDPRQGRRLRRHVPSRARPALDLGDVQGRRTLRTGRRTSPATSAQNAAPTPRTVIPDAATRKHTTAASRPVLVGERTGQRRAEGAEQGQPGGRLDHVAGSRGDQSGQRRAGQGEDQVGHRRR